MRIFVPEVASALHQLGEDGVAREAELWDRQTLLKRAFKRMDEYIDSELRQRSHTFGDLYSAGDSGESVARRAGEPAGQGENVLGEFGWVENLELGTEDGHVDGEHIR
jgi:hypothetical protein